MKESFVLEALSVTEAAALASFPMIGRGDEKGADQVAVDAMRSALDNLRIQGTVAIGEGERDKAPLLFVGEKVGLQEGPEIDIALDPLEGTSITAKGGPGALSVLAFSAPGGFLKSPDVYMDKMAVGPHFCAETIHLSAPIEENLRALAKEKGTSLEELVICILDRPRHETLIRDIRAQGCRIKLIPDGDISAVIETALPERGVDMYVGRGGAPEGVLAAAALRCMGGHMEARLIFQNEAEKEKATLWGIEDFNRIYSLHDLASGDVIFSATGVTDGDLLKGVHPSWLGTGKGDLSTNSLVMRSATGTIQKIETHHRLRPASSRPFQASA